VDRNPAAVDLPAPVTRSALIAHVQARARALAASPYEAPDTVLPASLKGLDYDRTRAIRYRPEAALWRGRGLFEVQLFHRTGVQAGTVPIHVVEDGTARTLAFTPDRFSYDGPSAGLGDDLGSAGAATLGHAGFRIHYPVNSPEVMDEVAVFLGASYFRLLGPGQVHGLSTRGLALDVAEPTGEEFPDFREFWLVRPDPGDTSMVFYALLDSPSVTGAYAFELVPGRQTAGTTLHVQARLHARTDVTRLGVAPLTSMFLFGPSQSSDFDDFRTRVHDSEGLLMRTGDEEWIWRPLSNGPGLRVTSLRDESPRGFGLVQRTRAFEDYLDLEARYHRRPSQWVRVDGGDWGSGGVELVEIPSASEFNDNIVAYWRPDRPLRAGESRTFDYSVVTFDDQLPPEPGLRVARSRSAWDALPGQVDPPPLSQRRIVVDFVGNTDEGSPEASPEAMLSNSTGDVSDLSVAPLPGAQGWRVSFRLIPDGDRGSDLRLYLARDSQAVSETWSYLWIP